MGIGIDLRRPTVADLCGPADPGGRASALYSSTTNSSATTTRSPTRRQLAALPAADQQRFERALARAGALITLLGACVGAPPAADGLTPPVPADCSRDVTTDFNAWVASLDDGVTITLQRDGCYLSAGSIEFRNKRDVTIEGNGATIRRPSDAVAANRPQVLLIMGGGFAIRDLTIQGTKLEDCAVPGQPSCFNRNREFDRNIHVYGTDGVLIDDVDFRNAWGDAVVAFPGPPGGWDSEGNGATMARNVTVQNSTVDTAGRHAFSCSGCRNMTIRDNRITNVGYHLMDLEVEAKVWTGDVTLERNTYSKVYFSLLAALAANGKDIGPVIVRGNTRTDQPVTCQSPVIVGRTGFPYHTVRISNNNLGAHGAGIQVFGADAEVTGNTIQFSRGGCTFPGIIFVDVPQGSITGNTILNLPVDITRVTGPGSVTNCGNRAAAAGPFDLPVPC